MSSVCGKNAMKPAKETKWGSEVEVERRNRIQLSIAAYAYEFQDEPLVSDADFDEAALQIRPEMDTGNPVMDAFFRKEFSASTGMWIRKHPDLPGIAYIHRRLASYLNQGENHDTSSTDQGT